MLNFLKNLITDRQKQLEKQNKLDESLKKIRNKCPQTLIDFFLIERQLNRIQCSNIDNSKILDYPDIILNNLKILEKRNNELMLILESNNVCNLLEKSNIKIINENL